MEVVYRRCSVEVEEVGSLTRLWLSMIWCSRIMKSAEVLMTEPSDRMSTSEPARAWNKTCSLSLDQGEVCSMTADL